MKIGVSLSPAFLCGEASSVHQEKMLSGGVQTFLARLRSAGCTHIELRVVREGVPANVIAGAAAAVHEAGLFMTAHGVLADEPAEVFWARFQPLMALQPDLCVTVHSVASREETVRRLLVMARYAQAHHPAARIALENNRSRKGDNIDIVECRGVGATVEAAGLANIGTCWDFGHFYWDCIAHPALLPDVLPPEQFLKRAIHTHIHSVYSDTTHFPLTMGDLPLVEYVAALAHAGFEGVYNLEPEPERWPENVDAADEILRSVAVLSDALLRIRP